MKLVKGNHKFIKYSASFSAALLGIALLFTFIGVDSYARIIGMLYLIGIFVLAICTALAILRGFGMTNGKSINLGIISCFGAIITVTIWLILSIPIRLFVL